MAQVRETRGLKTRALDRFEFGFQQQARSVFERVEVQWHRVVP
jgi:hypothetical protein